MIDETAFRAVDFFLNRTSHSKRIAIGFYGGEPLLKFDLIKKVVEKINRKYRKLKDKVNYSLTTNGLLFKSEISDFLVENKFNISISLDGPPGIHDKWRTFRDDTPSFDIISQNLVKLKQKYPQFYKESIAFEATIPPPYELLKVNDFFIYQSITRDVSARYNYVNDMDEMQTPFLKDPEKIKDNITKAKEFLVKSLKDNDFDKITNLISIWIPALKRIHYRERLTSSIKLNINGICLPGVRRLFVSSEGDFFLCEKLDYFQSIGSVEKGFDYEAIHRIINTYMEGVKTNCGKCWARYFCNLCFISTAGKGSININNKSTYCNILKNRVESSLQLYLNITENNPNALDEFFKYAGHQNLEEEQL